MNSVQENKNELEAAVRYCESAISRAKATIESMEFRQQAATKAWHEQTGREEALQREVAELKVQLSEREDKWDDAMNENRELHLKLEELKANMALMTDEIEGLKQANMGLVCDEDDFKDEITDLKKDNDYLLKSNATMRQANARLLNKQQEMEQTIQLQKEQIAMFQRKMSRLNEVDR